MREFKPASKPFPTPHSGGEPGGAASYISRQGKGREAGMLYYLVSLWSVGITLVCAMYVARTLIEKREAHAARTDRRGGSQL